MRVRVARVASGRPASALALDKVHGIGQALEIAAQLLRLSRSGTAGRDFLVQPGQRYFLPNEGRGERAHRQEETERRRRPDQGTVVGTIEQPAVILDCLATKSLRRKGVRIMLGESVRAADKGGLELSGGGRVDAETVVWTAGVRAVTILDLDAGAIARGGRIKGLRHCTSRITRRCS